MYDRYDLECDRLLVEHIVGDRSCVGAMSELCFYLRLGCFGRGLAFAAMFSNSRDNFFWQMLNPLCGQQMVVNCEGLGQSIRSLFDLR